MKVYFLACLRTSGLGYVLETNDQNLIDFIERFTRDVLPKCQIERIKTPVFKGRTTVLTCNLENYDSEVCSAITPIVLDLIAEEGWEPFSTTSGPGGFDRIIYFRRLGKSYFADERARLRKLGFKED